MRPVVKGEWPQRNGREIVFAEYGDAQPYLIDRIHDFCSYCENQITNLHVEHEQAKNVAPGIEHNWYNFLLACVSCNSRKPDGWINMDDYYWADVHNTYLLFDYLPGGVVTLKAQYPIEIDRNRTQRTMNLIGLGLYGNATTNRDRRWIKRSEAWGKAEYSLEHYENNNHDVNYIQCIVNNATSTGFWSVWMKIFENHPVVQQRLIDSFKGTFSGCLYSNINRL